MPDCTCTPPGAWIPCGECIREGYRGATQMQFPGLESTTRILPKEANTNRLRDLVRDLRFELGDATPDIQRLRWILDDLERELGL